MSGPGYVGVETEYGITVDGPTPVNPVVASSLVVSAYRAAGPGEVRWDHTDESPLVDAREPRRVPSLEPMIDDELGLANAVLTNGARFYVDHAHPEYATPECTNARDLLIWDRAGERILADAAERASASLPAGSRVLIHKNNTDGKGAAYGTHENYLVARSVPFGRLTYRLVPFFVSRPLLIGAGRVGSHLDASIEFQLTQRADFFEVVLGLETTLKRPLMNTRDEPHADPDRYRRLHVINGDANLCEVATYLKVGTMLLVLAAIEDEALPEPPELADPVAAFHAVSHDLTGRVALPLASGGRITPVELQRWYLEVVTDHLAGRSGTEVERDVLARWREGVEVAAEDPRLLTGLADWATKLELLEQYRGRHGLGWQHDRLKMLDLQYHDVRVERGLYHRLAARGRVVQLVSDEEVEAAVTTPPTDTRAWFRGEVIRRFGSQVVAAGWDAIVLDTGGERLQRVPMREPGRGTREQLGALLDEVHDTAELLARLTA
ncbi:MAG: depupylase/deamidase Dop [Nitriliruptoraceae bacterium]